VSARGICTIDFRDPLSRSRIAELRSARAGQETRPYVGCGGRKLWCRAEVSRIYRTSKSSEV